MNAPEQIRRLVERFERNQGSYTSDQYNEAQVRREFIEPFFQILGWDIYNTRGYAELYKEVIHEDAIKIGGITKAPDYCFRIGGMRKFFVEAKRPSVDLAKDVSAAFQLRRYAWSAKLPLSILTDFEEFAVYDCRIRPFAGDKASAARIMYLGYKQYIDNWDKIVAVFSREAILQGSFDQYAESTRKKKGTAEVDEAFLAEIESWRSLLARNIALRNPSLSQRELNFSVQRTIDRIIFLRICEDRGIEEYGKLLSLAEGVDVYKRLCNVFRRADERYNSGLFHFYQERDRLEIPDKLTLELFVDDKPLKQVFESLYYPDSPYEFSVIPTEILGQVYEQFLGKVIRLTPGHKAIIEDKPEVKRSGGVFYTPSYIVDYIVARTVGKMVEGKSPKEVRKLRVLDPACGSGSFLIGAYQFLLDWYLESYVAEGPERHSDKLYQGAGGTWRLSTAERKSILLRNIYGVDVDSQAVEVTKLSLLLKVLEGESSESLSRQYRLFQERALPDLGSNIKCGNSLVGSDFYELEQFSLIDEEERLRVNVFNWDTEFPGVLGKRGGFDVILGNPPYIRVQRLNHREVDYFFASYSTATGKTDASQLFIERSLSLVKPGGVIGFVCTSQWMNTDYGSRMRELLSKGRIREIINFGSLPVFKNADTYPAIMILSNKISSALTYKEAKSKAQLNRVGLNSLPGREILFGQLSSKPWSFGALDLESHLDAGGLAWRALGLIAPAYYGVVTGMDSVFVLKAEEARQLGIEDEIIFPFANRGEEIDSYCMVNPENVVIYPYIEDSNGDSRMLSEGELRVNYPSAYQYLRSRRELLRQRMDSRRLYADGANWFCLVRPGNYRLIRSEKLCVKGLSRSLKVGILRNGCAFSGANCPALVVRDVLSENIKYLLGVLNSQLMTYYVRQVCPPKLGGYRRFNTNNLNNLPIRRVDLRRKEDARRYGQIVDSVEQMLLVQGKMGRIGTGQDRVAMRRQVVLLMERIDGCVYELYGLREEDVTLVKESLASSAAGEY